MARNKMRKGFNAGVFYRRLSGDILFGANAYWIMKTTNSATSTAIPSAAKR